MSSFREKGRKLERRRGELEVVKTKLLKIITIYQVLGYQLFLRYAISSLVTSYVYISSETKGLCSWTPLCVNDDLGVVSTIFGWFVMI